MLVSKITIPNGITKIEKETFCGCKSLVSINIPDSVTEIESMAFFECESLNNLVIPQNVTNLGLNVFSGCKKMTSLTAPIKFFKDEYIQDIKREEAKGLNNTESEERSEKLVRVFNYFRLNNTESEERSEFCDS